MRAVLRCIDKAVKFAVGNRYCKLVWPSLVERGLDEVCAGCGADLKEPDWALINERLWPAASVL